MAPHISRKVDDHSITWNDFERIVEDVVGDILSKLETLDTLKSHDLKFVMKNLGLTDLDGEDLSGADLSHQNLSGLSFRHVSFVDANCSATNFDGCDLSFADFNGAVTTGAKFDRARLKGVKGLAKAAASTQSVQTKNRRVHNALYEHVFLARQDLTTAQVETLTEDFKQVVTEGNGRVVNSEYWGLRTLAYRIAKNRKAHYVMLNIDAPAAAVAELERQVGLNEDIIRSMTVRVEALSSEPSAMSGRIETRDRGEFHGGVDNAPARVGRREGRGERPRRVRAEGRDQT